jgi:type VII secretion integral membrane protein EccD
MDSTLRRVTVVAPRGRIDLSVPVHSSVAELLPQLVHLAAQRDAVSPASGWVLSLIGTGPLAAATTIGNAGVVDGDLLYLNPATDGPGPILFDDAVDAIASAAADRPGAWRPAAARRVAAVAAALVFGGADALVGLAGPLRPVAALLAAALALLLLLAGAALARAYGDSLVGAALAAGGLPGAAATGALLATGTTAVALALAGVALLGVLAAVLIPDRAVWFIGVVVAAGAGAVAATITAGFGVRPVSTAAVLTVVVVALGALLPVIALRLAGLPLPRIPTDLAAFRRDDKPTPAQHVRDATLVAAGGLTTLLFGLGATVAGCAVVLLSGTPSRWAECLAGAAGAALLLRSRAYAGLGQRLALLSGGAVALALTGVRVCQGGGARTWLVVLVLLVVVGAASAAHAVRAPQHVPSPYWSRALDMFEIVALLALAPTAAQVLGVFAALRSLGG